ncbi:unnamed protein product [Bursaphelenchus xylophilus]|uniref:(pine wood nematode) hypothetical protein n=1 Tax=Bursaphelenchus xylophilus TaxID=6326 RepID=A0A1I7SB53_BURXY|nr:unnamed protein product [Bursaphelenchus xylophilus]CAG9131755.1 unnamed protein product [Bursaphelenchus xylophilus]
MVLCEAGLTDASSPCPRSVTSLEDPQIHVVESGDADSMPGIRLLTKCKPISTPECEDIAKLPLTPIRPVRQQPVFFTPVRQPKRRSLVGRVLTRIFNCTQPQKVKERFEETAPTKKHRDSLVLNGVQDKRKGSKVLFAWFLLSLLLFLACCALVMVDI